MCCMLLLLAKWAGGPSTFMPLAFIKEMSYRHCSSVHFHFRRHSRPTAATAKRPFMASYVLVCPRMYVSKLVIKVQFWSALRRERITIKYLPVATTLVRFSLPRRLIANAISVLISSIKGKWKWNRKSAFCWPVTVAFFFWPLVQLGSAEN